MGQQAGVNSSAQNFNANAEIPSGPVALLTEKNKQAVSTFFLASIKSLLPVEMYSKTLLHSAVCQTFYKTCLVCLL